MSITFGEKLELFYISLQTENDIHLILDLLSDLEYHIPIKQANEDATAIVEIISDCRKKAFQVIRSPLAQKITKLVTDCRKRLTTKVNKVITTDADSAALHSNRHLHILIELLGDWSNIVSTVVITREYDISRENASTLLSSLYTRIIEVCFECFATLKHDKDLDNLMVRVMTAPHRDVNLESLDAMVGQLASMREILNQHYSFLHHTFSLLPSTSTTTSPPPSVIAMTQTPNKSQSNPQRAAAYIESMLLVTPDEFPKWRELEALYISLEMGYLSRAVTEAFRGDEDMLGNVQHTGPYLLEIEDIVYIPQAVEDVFFLINKCTERAATTGSESCIFGVGNKVVELLGSNEGEDSHNHALLYRITTSKRTYRHCIDNQHIDNYIFEAVWSAMNTTNEPHNKQLKSTLNNTNSNDSLVSVSLLSGSTTQKNSTQDMTNNINCTPVKSTAANNDIRASSPLPVLSHFLSEGSNTLTTSTSNLKGLITDVVGSSQAFKGASSWLVGLASPYMISDETSAPHTPTTSGDGSNRNSALSAQNTRSGIAYKDNNGSSNSDSTNHVGSGANGLSKPPLIAGSVRQEHSSVNSSNGNSVFSTPSGKKTSTTASLSVSKGSGGSSMHKVTPPPSSSGAKPSLDELFLQAFCEDASSDQQPQQMTSGTYSQQNSGDERALSEQDWLIQLNTLSMVVTSIKNLQKSYTATMTMLDNRGRSSEEMMSSNSAPSSGGGGNRSKCVVNFNNYNSSSGDNRATTAASTSSISIVLQELASCEKRYRAHLNREIRAYTEGIYRTYLQKQLEQFVSKSYTITGAEMDQRLMECHLLSAVRKCIAPTEVVLESHDDTTDDIDEDGSSKPVPVKKQDIKIYRVPYFLHQCGTCLSVDAFHYVLCELSTMIVDTLREDLIYKKMFTEWGAMLLYQEVCGMALYMESLIDSMEQNRELKDCHEGLILTTKILGLEQPKEVSRFKIPTKFLTEADVRRVLSRRSDFSRSDQDAIANVKLQFV